jgi:hypothetical protein
MQAQPQEAAVEPQQQEEARKQVFHDGMTAIVEDLNRNSYSRLVAAIDQDAMLEQIYGLRLIDQRMKRDFSERMSQPGQFENFIASQYQAEAQEGIRARLLTVESRADRGRAVVRFDMPFFQANYLEYDLRLVENKQLQVVDWTDYGWGHRFTDWIGLEMIATQPNENAARKLVDFPSVQQAQVFQMMEILKSTRDMKLDRYWQIVDTMDEQMRRQRVVWKLGLDATRKARKRRDQRKVLEGIDKYYPQDVLFALPLLDYYFPAQKYDKAYEALVRVRDKLRVDDALTNARLSSTELVMNRVDEAVASAEKATEQEADLELGWWSLFRARVATGDHASAIVALETLNESFGHELDAATLSKDPALQKFVASDEFLEWQQGSDGSN